MDNYIKLTSDLDIRFSDLMCPVDLSHEFTLRDVLRACVSSTEIPPLLMGQILHCNALQEFYDDAESKPFEDEGDLEYLELYLLGDIGEDYSSSQWSFHGVGKLGVVPKDDFRKMTPEEAASFRESYGVELSPLYRLADYKIKVRNEIVISNWKEKDYSKQITRINFQPSITLIEILYWVIWELSFFGSPSKRDEENAELKRRIEEIDEAKKNGTLDQITIPWEKVKADLEAKFDFKLSEDDSEKTS
jgi:hypothetical protein